MCGCEPGDPAKCPRGEGDPCICGCHDAWEDEQIRKAQAALPPAAPGRSDQETAEGCPGPNGKHLWSVSRRTCLWCPAIGPVTGSEPKDTATENRLRAEFKRRTFLDSTHNIGAFHAFLAGVEVGKTWDWEEM